MTANLAKLTRAVTNYHQATNGAQRDAARRFVCKRANEVEPEGQALKTRLERGWTWLDAHAGHPDHDETEAMWLADLEDYERIEDALANALAVMTGTSGTQARREAA